MSISAIFSNTISQLQKGAQQSPQLQFQQLSKDLQSGNLSAAQSDFATLQAAFSQSATTSGSASTTSTSTSTSTSNPIAQAFNQLARDLQSGNLSAAQKDYSTIQQDLQSSGHSHNNLRDRTGGSSGNSSSTGSADSTQSSLAQDLNQIGQSLTAGNLTGAQTAYATLQQQLQQFAFGGGSLNSRSSSPVSLEA